MQPWGVRKKTSDVSDVTDVGHGYGRRGVGVGGMRVCGWA